MRPRAFRWHILASSIGAILALSSTSLRAQEWRERSAHVGSSARVLLIGARPEDDDCALVSWLSLGRHVETAFLSLTRGESGVNVSGPEREFPLGAVRTAELLATRPRDRAHQYFTRAYDFGFTASDSVVDVAWPHDSLLKDVVSVIRAFRPHVIVVLNAEASARDATRRRTARLAAEAFAAAADTVRWPAATTSRLSAWTVSRLFTRVDSALAGGVTIDVGAFDNARGRSYAELGAESRRLQRTQPAPAAPPTGRVVRTLRIDSTRVGAGAMLFGAIDTSLTRFRALPAAVLSASLAAQLDSLRRDLDAVRGASSGDGGELAVALARVAHRASTARLEFSCRDESGVPTCAGLVGDLAVTLTTIRERATRTMLDAAGLVVDGTVARQLVAAGDSVPVAVSIYNGGTLPVTIRRVAAFGPTRLTLIARDTAVVVQPDSASAFTAHVRMTTPSYFWWQINGLVEGTRIHDFRTTPRAPVVPRLIGGEDRIVTSGVEATITIGGVDVPVIVQPLVYRGLTTLRGDVSRPLIAVPAFTVLVDRQAEYERAGSPVDRLFRVFVSSARSVTDTVTVELSLPTGLRADSLRRIVVLPPFTATNLFYRVRGALPPGEQVISATVVRAASPSGAPEAVFRAGAVTRDYPHIPTQHFQRVAENRIESVALRVPPTLRVVYVRGTDDLRESFTQLKLNVRTIDALLLPVFDLRGYTTILVGAGALSGEAGAVMLPALQNFARGGGTVVILPGADDVTRSGLLPADVVIDAMPGRISDPAAAIGVVAPTSSLLRWPNVVAPADFTRWSGHRARGVPTSVGANVTTPLVIREPGQTQSIAPLLVARTGSGRVIYTALSLDAQLDAAHAGAARLLVNLLSAGLSPAVR